MQCTCSAAPGRGAFRQRRSYSQQAVRLAIGPHVATHRHNNALLTQVVRVRERQNVAGTATAFETLSASLPTCLAVISTSETGLRGLSASRNLQEGQLALLVPHSHSLSVPSGGKGSAARWREEFLRPWEAAHGQLPSSLTSFLADTGVDATVRVAAWLLYLRKCCSGSSTGSSHPSPYCLSSSGSRAFWCSWLALLPGPEEATNANGFWTPEELQQLQVEPYQGVMTAVNSLTKEMCSQALLRLQDGDLGRLQLADSVEDIQWGVFATRSRATSHGDTVALRPAHDLLNHAAPPNTRCTLTEEGYAIEALMDISPGTELTISYTGDDEFGDPDLELDTPALEMLMTWGFTLGHSPQDILLPIQYHALPALPWRAVVAAAAAVVAAADADSRTGAAGEAAGGLNRIGAGSSWQGGQLELLRQLQAAVSSLPIMRGADGGSGSGGGGSAVLKKATDALNRYGMLGSACADAGSRYPGGAGRGEDTGSGGGNGLFQLVSSTAAASTSATLAGRQANTSSSSSNSNSNSNSSSSSSAISDLESVVAAAPAWAVFERSYLAQMQLQELQHEFAAEVVGQLPLMHKLQLAAAAHGPSSAAAAVATVAAVALTPVASVAHRLAAAATTTGSSSSSSGSMPAMQAAGRVLAASTLSNSSSRLQTVELQQMVVRALLSELQFTLLQSGTSIEQDRAVLRFLQGDVSATLPPPTGPGSMLASLGAAARAILVAASRVPAAVAAPRVAPPRLELRGDEVQQFKGRQLELLTQLMALQGAGPPEAAALHSSTPTATAAVKPPVAVMSADAFTRTSVQLSAASSPSATFSFAVSKAAGPVPAFSTTLFVPEDRSPPQAGRQQLAALLMQQEQQLQGWSAAAQQQHLPQGEYAACQDAVAEAAALLSGGRVSRSRMATAVAARLQHKQLLLTCVKLLRQVDQQLRLQLTHGLTL